VLPYSSSKSIKKVLPKAENDYLANGFMAVEDFQTIQP
jgi:hypothetical protein